MLSSNMAASAEPHMLLTLASLCPSYLLFNKIPNSSGSPFNNYFNRNVWRKVRNIN